MHVCRCLQTLFSHDHSLRMALIAVIGSHQGLDVFALHKRRSPESGQTEKDKGKGDRTQRIWGSITNRTSNIIKW